MRTQIFPLNESELNRLEQLLDHIRPGSAMTLAEIDGYLCALVCGPNSDRMPDRMRHVVGGHVTDELPIYSVEKETKEAQALLIRQWNAIALTFTSGQPYIPIFDVGDDGTPAGKEWAHGFARGMNRDQFKWDRFLRDKENQGVISLLALLVAERNPDLVPGGIGPIIDAEKRVELLAGIVACLTQFFRHFHGGSRFA